MGKGIRTYVSRLAHRYIIVGVWNTVFGIANFYMLLWLFGESHYLMVLTASYCLSILQGHFSQRLFVWHSKAPYLRELIRFSSGFLLQYFLNLTLLHVAVKSLRLDLRWSQLAILAILSVFGFLFNKRWVFSRDIEGLTQG